MIPKKELPILSWRDGNVYMRVKGVNRKRRNWANQEHALQYTAIYMIALGLSDPGSITKLTFCTDTVFINQFYEFFRKIQLF